MTATLSFPTDEGDYAFVVDGQHRLFSFQDDYRRLPKDEVFELPVVALYNATDERVGETFISINVNQKPVNKDLLTQMKAILGLLDTDIEKATHELVTVLDEEATSPLKGRILRLPNEKNKYVKTNQLMPVIKALLLPGGCLHDKTQAERKRIIIDYLNAVAQVFSDAWADGGKKQSYSLLQPSGLQIMLSLLPDVIQRCDFSEQFKYNTDTFKRQLQPLVDTALLGEWKRSVVENSISTKPRREMFLGQLKQALKVKPPSQTANPTLFDSDAV